ncbi:ShlB/FhaC/HecB family hemolysin secretion/activation protein (plasmid) [Comamonadaceae bacterium OTU4NAUVB1]|nr:ShlB/FhaC/HecB family hemolysin secretion/activation protein [Comamonadaceae bacterium OTU4NAUVB1]
MRTGTLGALIGALAQAASAQIDANALDRQNQLIERQQQDLLRLDQERARRAPSTQPGADLRDVRPQVNVPDIGVACRDIRTVRIDGAEHLPADVARRIETDFAGRCLGVGELEAVLAQITKRYIDRGLITTRAYLPAQDLRTGTLQINVIEGRIEAYRVDGPRAASVWPRGVFPATPGELLDLRDLEQGIDQINRLASSRAVLDIQPGSRPGDSVVVVKNPSVLPVNLYASADNYGTRATGRDSASATVSFDSVLGLNEMLSLTRRATVPHDADHDATINAAQFSIPFGYSTLSLDHSQSRYANRLSLPSGATLLSTGKTTTRSAALDRVVYRDQASRVSLSGRLSTQETESYLGGQFLGIASRKLAYADVGVSGFTAMAGGLANARLGHVKGLSDFGALRDAADLPEEAPHAQFRKVVLDVGFNRRFDIAKQPLLWSSQFSAQHAYDTLYGSQQFLVGGVSTVRGALMSTLSGDDGYLLRNELSLPWQLPSEGATLGGRVYVAYDFGHVRNRAPGVPSGSLSGATLGTTVNWKRTSLDLFAARALHVPSPLVRESTRFGFRLSVSL